MVEGAPPEVGEFTIDVDSAAKHGFVIGDTYEVMIPSGRDDLTLSGTTSFGEDNATLGAVLVQMSTAEAGELFGVDGVSTVDVRLAEGADAAAVQAAVAAAVPAAEVVDNATVLDETASEFTDEIDVVRNILLGFGGVALFVSIFIIYNTFGIVLGQRTSELALLRTVGADPPPDPAFRPRSRHSSSAARLGRRHRRRDRGGQGNRGLVRPKGVDLSDYPLVMATRTVVTAVVVGIGVTLLAAIGPARAGGNGGADGRCSRMAPQPEASGRAGGWARGVVLFGAGLAAGRRSRRCRIDHGDRRRHGAGAVAIFLGVAMLSPLAVGIVTACVRMAGANRRCRRRHGTQERRPQPPPDGHDRGGADDRPGAGLDRAGGRPVGEGGLGSTFERSAKADYYVTDELEDVDFPATWSRAAPVGRRRRRDRLQPCRSPCRRHGQ